VVIEQLGGNIPGEHQEWFENLRGLSALEIETDSPTLHPLLQTKSQLLSDIGGPRSHPDICGVLALFWFEYRTENA